MPNWLSLLSVAVSLIPQTTQEISAAIHDHWGSDHVQQLAKGADLLGQLASTVVKTVTDRQGVQAPAPAAAAAPTVDMNALADLVVAKLKGASA